VLTVHLQFQRAQDFLLALWRETDRLSRVQPLGHYFKSFTNSPLRGEVCHSRRARIGIKDVQTIA
jgi:hypothetical protein